MFRRIVSGVFVVMLLLVKLQAAYPTFTAADLLVVDGKVYHLSLAPENLAPNVILVGDPDRVPFLAEHCFRGGRVTADAYHRGLRTMTGITERGIPVSIVTSGMGTPSVEIVLNELVILNEIDLERRVRRDEPMYKKMNIIRLGTSGGLQESTRLGTPIISAYAVGMDNSGLFYTAFGEDASATELASLCTDAIDTAVGDSSAFVRQIFPYAAPASPEVIAALRMAAEREHADAKVGITVSNSGFFANQGRNIVGIELTIPDIDEILSTIRFRDLYIENMEMEASFMFHFVYALNHRLTGTSSARYYVGALCPAIANRRLDTFDAHYEENVLLSLRMILDAFGSLMPID